MQRAMNHSKYVLIVDDEQHQTRMLGMLLQTRGYDVATAFTGTEAFQKISPDTDLVILDLVLPDIDGFEVCRQIKQNDKLRHIPVIVLSAYSMSEDRLKSFNFGADDFLAKPCEHEELFARMEAVLRRHDQGGITGDEKMIKELHRILEDGAIVTYYQPIYTLQPFKLLGVEVLTRPVTLGLLGNPERFFQTALQYGLYPEIELMAWSNALSEMSNKKFAGKIFLNCNPYFVESPQFTKVQTLMEKYQIDPKNVIFEITERSAIPDYQLFYERLKPYKNHGFDFAVDDLGCGYSSLESIVEIRPNYVKIDGHIVRDLYKDDFKRGVVEFVVNFCKQHGILVVAEGIENQRDLDAARNLGLDAGQGYFFCKPQGELHAEDFKKLARSAKFHPNGNSFSI